MDEGSGKRSSLDRRMATRAGIAVGAIVVVMAVLGPSLLRTPPPSPAPSGPLAVASPAGTPAGTQPPEPSQTPDPWSDLDVPEFVALAELTPLDTDRIGIAPNSSFRLRSLTKTPAVDLAAGLRSDPPVKLLVEAGETADVAVVRAATALDPGERYRFRLNAPDGALIGGWAFTTRAPLHVVGTLPGDRTTGVPPSTGIEITFDQDGTTGVPQRFSIEPAVSGRFEQHGRTWAFVPDQPLAPARIYTVTIKAGVGVDGSTETLERDVVFEFETGLQDQRAPLVTFGREILEVRPSIAPDIAVWLDEDDDEDRPRLPDSVTVLAHRLPSFSAVVDAATVLAGPDGWALASPGAVIDTTELTRVARVDSPLVEYADGYVLRIPAEFDAGFYVLTIEQPGAPAQALLQVTNLSAYALTASEDTIVWVNDLATTAPISDAIVSIAGGDRLGATGADGLLRTATPAGLGAGERPAETYDDEDQRRREPARFLTVRAPDGRRLLLALGLPVAWSYREATTWSWHAANRDWWVAFFTDRQAYRQTDTIHVSGTILAREGRSAPESVEIRLRPQDGSPDAPILRVRAKPSERGVFVADLRLDDLPRAAYEIDLVVAGRRVSTAWIEVTEIRKPAYRIDVATDRRAYLAGEEVHASAVATFYDGAPVPGMDLEFQGFGDEVVVASGAAGQAAASLRATFGDRPSGFIYEYVGVAPAHPEEGQISGERWLLVLPSRSWLEAEGTVTDGRIVVTGTLSRVDLAKLEAAIAADRELDPAGSPIAGGTVRAAVVHIIPVRRQIGTAYDFIEKRVVPVYEYDERREQIATRTLTTAADGTFRLSLAAPVPGDAYLITLTTSDAQGRRFLAEAYATTPAEGSPSYHRLPYLEAVGGCGTTPTIEARLGAPVDVTMRDADGSLANEGRLLFLVGALGSMEATIQDEATFVRSLRDADLPGFTVRAVWLRPGSYFVADLDVVVDPADKTITVTLQPDRARYRPGGTVNLAVTTTDAAGRPIATDVILQGVDEKLYSLGFAMSQDPLSGLLASTSPEFLDAYRSHAAPSAGIDGGCGDTGGGRADFRDTVTFQRITTDANGRGVATFALSDDLTSWRMTAMAFSGNLDAGVATVQIPVGLPFFVEAVLAREYLVGDEPVLLVRGYGEALEGDSNVTFTVSAPSLGLEPTTVRASAFQPARVPLPAVTPGDHQIRIEAEVRLGERVRRDVLIRSIHVVNSRLSALSTTFETLGAGFTPQGGDGLTRFVITDVGRARLLPLLDELVSARSARFDRAVVAEMARTLLIEEFGVPETSLDTSGFDAERYLQGGIALLPYASADLVLTAKAALVVRSEINVPTIRERLREWADGGESEEAVTRERTIIALAGLAGLGEDVADRLHAFDPADLTVIERLWLGLGLAATGDDAAALAIERALLADAGQRLGPWVRLLGPTAVQSQEASALLLLLAARLGDPIADDVARYLADNPSREQVFPLEHLGYVEAVLERLPRAPARFAWTLDGERHEETLRPGGSKTLVLTRGQWTGLRLEPLEGDLGVSTTHDSASVALPASPLLSIVRTVTPSEGATTDRVRVRIEVTFTGQLPLSCYRLTDLLPSGLAPVAQVAGWMDDEEAPSRNGPWEVEGQRITWCASPEDRSRVYEYSARVVTPGTYRWEPAVLQWEAGPELGASTAATTYVIR